MMIQNGFTPSDLLAMKPGNRPGGYNSGEDVRRGQATINAFFDGEGFVECQQEWSAHQSTSVLPYGFLTGPESNNNIQGGEVVFQLLPTKCDGLQNAYVRSVLNGIPLPDSVLKRSIPAHVTDQADKDKIITKRQRQALYGRMTITGIAQHAVEYSSGKSTGCPVVVSGIKTVVNSSKKAIQTGDLIIATFPDKVSALSRQVLETSPMSAKMLLKEVFAEDLMFQTKEFRNFMSSTIKLVTATLIVGGFDDKKLKDAVNSADWKKMFTKDAAESDADFADRVKADAVKFEGNMKRFASWPNLEDMAQAMTNVVRREGKPQEVMMAGLVPVAGILLSTLTSRTLGVATQNAPPMGKFKLMVTTPTRNIVSEMMNY
jgi:hypothetical protein